MPNTLARVVGSPTMKSPPAMRVGNRAMVTGAFHAGLGVQPGAGSETIVPSSRGGSSTMARCKRGRLRAGTAGAEPFARVSTSFMPSSHGSSSTTRASARTCLLARQRAKTSSGRLVPRPRRRLMPPEYYLPRSRRPKMNKMRSSPPAPHSGARDVPFCTPHDRDPVNVRCVVMSVPRTGRTLPLDTKRLRSALSGSAFGAMGCEGGQKVRRTLVPSVFAATGFRVSSLGRLFGWRWQCRDSVCCVRCKRRHSDRRAAAGRVRAAARAGENAIRFAATSAVGMARSSARLGMFGVVAMPRPLAT